MNKCQYCERWFYGNREDTFIKIIFHVVLCHGEERNLKINSKQVL